MKKWEKKHPILNTMIVLLGVIFMWRGLWGFLDVYFFPDNPIVTYGASIVIGFLILILDDFELDEL